MKKTLLVSLAILLLSAPVLFGEKGASSYSSGNQYYRTRNYTKAIHYYEKAISEEYIDNVIYYKLSICYREIKNYMKSMSLLDKAIALLEKVVDKKDLNS